MALQFIVRFSGTFFTKRDPDGCPRGTNYPGFATVMEYSVAADVAQSLRDAEYSDAIVCLPTGEPAQQSDIGLEPADVGRIASFIKIWGDN
jgi:hypothetical protein